MKLKRYHGNPILEKNPDHGWEAGSVLNPSVLYEDGIFRMVYRATNGDKPGETGHYVSSIGYAESTDGIHFTSSSEPLISPDQDYEKGLGCEDPRLTKIDGEYFLYYTAVKVLEHSWEVRIALATSKDFKHWEKHGIVGPKTKSKAAALFPHKVEGKYVLFYTWMADSPLSSIMEVKFDHLDELKQPMPGYIADNINQYEKNVVFEPPVHTFRGAEVGAVPIKTEHGWLLIYCTANTTDHAEWTISAALLDLNNPRKIIGHSEHPILEPETDSELHGIVNRVTFPEGAVMVGDELYVYYGSGDQGICLATCNLNDLINHLKR